MRVILVIFMQWDSDYSSYFYLEFFFRNKNSDFIIFINSLFIATSLSAVYIFALLCAIVRYNLFLLSMLLGKNKLFN